MLIFMRRLFNQTQDFKFGFSLNIPVKFYKIMIIMKTKSTFFC